MLEAHLTHPSSQGRGNQSRGGGGGGGGRGGARGGGPGGAGASGGDRPKREAILDLSKYTDKEIRVKFLGGRQGQSGGRVHKRS